MDGTTPTKGKPGRRVADDRQKRMLSSINEISIRGEDNLVEMLRGKNGMKFPADTARKTAKAIIQRIYGTTVPGPLPEEFALAQAVVGATEKTPAYYKALREWHNDHTDRRMAALRYFFVDGNEIDADILADVRRRFLKQVRTAIRERGGAVKTVSVDLSSAARDALTRLTAIHGSKPKAIEAALLKMVADLDR
jgi:hypothetical protein